MVKATLPHRDNLEAAMLRADAAEARVNVLETDLLRYKNKVRCCQGPTRNLRRKSKYWGVAIGVSLSATLILSINTCPRVVLFIVPWVMQAIALLLALWSWSIREETE